MRMLGGQSPRIEYSRGSDIGHQNNELRPAEGTVVDQQLSTLRLGRRPSDRQTQTGPKTTIVEALEFAEYALPRRDRNSRPRIAHDQPSAATLDTAHDGNRRPGGRMHANILQH